MRTLLIRRGAPAPPAAAPGPSRRAVKQGPARQVAKLSPPQRGVKLGPARRAVVVGGLALLVLLGGGVVGLRAGHGHDPARPAALAADPPPPAASSDAAIERAQQRLRLVPGDWVTWAALGSAYLERSRVSADPSWYPKADGALRRSLQLHPADNPAALAGLGALANSRHDFAGAADLARQALAVAQYHAPAYGVLADALTQLGDPAGATVAVQHLLDLRPGLAAYTRASYEEEQHGRDGAAYALMSRALDAATAPADVAFCRYQLGELAWWQGHLADADSQYTAGLAADPGYLPLRAGQARVAAARGQSAAALAGYARLTREYPAPGYFLEYADLLRSLDRSADADAQVALAAAVQQLFTANGGVDDLTGSAIALAQGRPADAVALAQREWQRRHFADVADALGWALHAAGQDGQALPYARQAGALGSTSPRYAYHLGMIELAVGDTAAARADLSRARAAGSALSPLDVPVLRAALTRSGAS